MSKWEFEVGDKVLFINDTGHGTILKKLAGNRYLIQDQDGFEETVLHDDLAVPFSKMNQVKSFSSEEVKPILSKEINALNGISEGDTIRPLDEEGEGIVRSITVKGIFVVEMDYGLTIEYNRNEIVKVGFERDRSLLENVERKNEVLKSDDFKKKTIAKKTDRKNEGVWEIDLHVHEITVETDNLGPAALLQIQMDHFELKLNEAIDRKVRKVIFIHGRGKGKLKNEIRAKLKHYPYCEFHDGNFQRYGQGATEVWIYNK